MAVAEARQHPSHHMRLSNLLVHYPVVAAAARAMAFEAEVTVVLGNPAEHDHPGRNFHFVSRPHFARRRFVPSPSPARRLLKLTGNPQVPFDDDESMPSLVDGF